MTASITPLEGGWNEVTFANRIGVKVRDQIKDLAIANDLEVRSCMAGEPRVVLKGEMAIIKLIAELPIATPGFHPETEQTLDPMRGLAVHSDQLRPVSHR